MEQRVPCGMASIGTTFSDDTFIKKYAKQLEGTLVMVGWWPYAYTPFTMPFIEAYTKRYGYSPVRYAVQAYEGLMLAVAGIQLAGSLDKAKIRDALERVNIPALWGQRYFSPLEKGHRTYTTMAIAQIQNGTKVPLWPLDIKKGEFKPVPPYSWELP